MPTEDVAVRDSLLRNRILQRASYMILPDNIYKLLWPVFSGENLITHGGTEFDYTYRKAGLTRRSRRKIRGHQIVVLTPSDLSLLNLRALRVRFRGSHDFVC